MLTLEHTPHVRDQHHGERRKWQEVPWRNQKNDTLQWFPYFTCLKQPNQTGITSEECCSSTSASFSPVSHMLRKQACLQLADKLCQVPKKEKKKTRDGVKLTWFLSTLVSLFAPTPQMLPVCMTESSGSLCLFCSLRYPTPHITWRCCECVGVFASMSSGSCSSLLSKAHVKFYFHCLYVLL